MIINNLKDLNLRINQMIECNKRIMLSSGQSSIILNKSLLSSPFSGSSYMSDLETDIATIVSRIAQDHLFYDGNKRTALMMLIMLSSEFGLNLKSSDNINVDIEDLVTHKISESEFRFRVFRK